MSTAARVTTKDVERAFGVTTMTVYNWRRGSPERDAMPHEKRGTRVLYLPSKVTAWARRHGVPQVAPLEAASAPRKPGPKAAPRAEA